VSKILVTGGGGFIGSHTVVELTTSGYEPIIIDDFSNSEHSVIKNLEKITGRKVIIYEGRFQDPKLLTRIFKSHKIDGVIHFAAFKAVGESVEQPLKYYDNNVAGLIKFLKQLEEFSVSNLVFSSSCTVYGEPDKLPITEESPVKPANSPYGATKQVCEIVIKDAVSASPQLKALSLRYFNPIGAHPSALIGELPKGVPANLVPFITQTAAGIRPKLTVHGDDYPTPDGTCIRDYIHVVDLAKAHIKALRLLERKTAKYYDVCNAGTGRGNSVLEVIKAFESVSRQKLNYEIGPRRPGDIIQMFAAVDKAKTLLGWRAEKDLADCLGDAWRWQQKLAKESHREG
jgi:UDP-glucose 4-epimerase